MLAIIGGTGLTDYNDLNIIEEIEMSTPYGEPSALITRAELYNTEFIFLSRHGKQHNIPPHRVNYLANIWSLKQCGASHIIAVNAVGGIHPDFGPGEIIFPNQLIDYSYSRQQTFFSDNLDKVTHIDFTEPYSSSLVKKLKHLSDELGYLSYDSGTYACTQGPRLETAAEIKRLATDGCDLVGMTGMPEAALARELEIDYASISVVANWAAGLSEQEISMNDIEAVLKVAILKVKKIIEAYLQAN